MSAVENNAKFYLNARKAYEKASKNVQDAYKHGGSFEDCLQSNIKQPTPVIREDNYNLRANKVTGVDVSILRNNFAISNSNFFKDRYINVFEKLGKDRISKIRKSEDKIKQAMEGDANTIEVMAAIAESDVALQEIVMIRDKIIGAYQEIFRMPI